MRMWTLPCPLCPVAIEADPEDPDAGLNDLWDHLLRHPAPDARKREQLFIQAQQNARQEGEANELQPREVHAVREVPDLPAAPAAHEGRVAVSESRPDAVTAYLDKVRQHGSSGKYYNPALLRNEDVPRLLAAVEAALKHHQPGKLPWCDACGPQHQPCQEVADIRRALLGEGETDA